MRVAVVAEWYPSPGDPVLGIWAHRQAVAARDAGAEVRVLALRRPIPPLSVARQVLHVPPAIGALGRWIAGARTSLRPVTLDGLSVTAGAVRGAAAADLVRQLGLLDGADAGARARSAVRGVALRRAARALPGAGRARGGALGVADGAQAVPAFVVSGHGPDMINVPENSSVGRRACVAAMARADLVVANSSWAARRCEEIAGRPLPVAGRAPGRRPGAGDARLE